MRPSHEARWSDAIGVLPIESVLAAEHDHIHGDQVTARIDASEVLFTAGQITDPSGFARRLLRAWTRMQGAGARMSRAIDTSELEAEEPPLDGVAIFALGALDDVHRPEVFRALGACIAARGTADAHMHMGQQMDEGANASSAVAQADAALVVAMVPHLNALLDAPLEREEVFQFFIEAGAVNALGTNESSMVRRANRRLLEAAFDGHIARLRDIRLDMVYDAIRRHDTAALCLSGGGIRSATFANGVIRALARRGLLGRFDYLSTVSGGGFAGSWLSAWMQHAGATAVHNALAQPCEEKLDPDPQPVRHLRAFSHYLAPRIGALSADTWTLGATVFRNLMFNWAVLLPLMAAALLVPRGVLSLMRISYSEIPAAAVPFADNLLSVLFVAGIVLMTYGLRFLHRYRPEDDATAHAGTGIHRRPFEGQQRDFVLHCFAPFLAAAVLLSLEFYLVWNWSERDAPMRVITKVMRVLDNGSLVVQDPLTQQTSVFGTLWMNQSLLRLSVGVGALLHIVGWALSGRPKQHAREVTVVALTGAAGGIGSLLIMLLFVTRPDSLERDAMYTTLAAPALLAMMVAGSQVFTALTSRRTSDAEREWFARFNAWMLIAIVAWIAACTLVIFGPVWVTEGWHHLTLALTGGLAGAIGLMIARSAGNPASEGPSRFILYAKRLTMALAAPVFVAALVIGLAGANEALINASCKVPGLSRALDCRAPVIGFDNLSRTQPFIVQARHRTDDLARMPDTILATRATHPLVMPFRAGDSASRELLARGDRTPARWDSLVRSVKSAATTAMISTALTDGILRTRMDKLERVALRADTAIVGTIGGNQAMRDSLLFRRITAVHLADSALHQLRVGRDSAATSMDAHLERMAAAVMSVPSDNLQARDSSMKFLRDVVDQRLSMSVEIFQDITRDSLARDSSEKWVRQEIATAPVVPHDAAVPVTIVMWFFALLGVGLLLGSLIDTNKFSLRAMYQMRLVRAYIGASRPAAGRRPNPFTGFDPHDDIPMAHLWPNWSPTPQGAGRSPDVPPFHVVNTTLNLVAGGNLAWQQRKAESMTFTPLHAGSAFVGYRPMSPATSGGKHDDKAKLYGGDKGVTLGTAVTISGAAASPNAGSLSSPIATFLMTFFNARLGAWLGNPGRAGAKTYHLGAPAQKITPILQEMFGMTTDQSPYVALSDGGHFENLALYEMVLRRCRLIVVSDAGCDPDATFGDLGTAVRKIRIDLGVPIEFPDGVDIRSRTAPPAAGGAYWAVGTIRYSAVDRSGDPAKTDGVLIYIKPALCGREPSDVQQYARTSPTFPHESTTDQFFSESQFESYRALGEFIVSDLLSGPIATKLDILANRSDSLLAQWPDIGKVISAPDHGAKYNLG